MPMCDDLQAEVETYRMTTDHWVMQNRIVSAQALPCLALRGGARLLPGHAHRSLPVDESTEINSCAQAPASHSNPRQALTAEIFLSFLIPMAGFDLKRPKFAD
jgi:hypothetical protein